MANKNLQEAWDYVAEQLRLGTAPARIIQGLIDDHGATIQTGRDPNTLRVAGVTSSCSWSAGNGLLENWKKTAGLRLIMAAQR